MFNRMLYIFSAVLSLPLLTMQVSKEEREPRKDNPVLHIKSPEQKARKQEKLQLNNLRNSQKAVEQQALSNAVKGQPSAQNVLQYFLDTE